jgi:hypothetical protein
MLCRADLLVEPRGTQAQDRTLRYIEIINAEVQMELHRRSDIRPGGGPIRGGPLERKVQVRNHGDSH